MNVEEGKRIWEMVKENHKKLDSCSSHDFSEVLNGENIARIKYKCTKCGGTVDFQVKHWYEEGRKHEATDMQSMQGSV